MKVERCPDCGKWVGHKPILGTMHLCVPEGSTPTEGPTPEQERDHLADQCSTLLRENEKMLAALKEAEFFFSEDFPNGPDGESCATPRYRDAYKAVLSAIAQVEERPNAPTLP